jgi:hypothetical protein
MWHVCNVHSVRISKPFNTLLNKENACSSRHCTLHGKTKLIPLPQIYSRHVFVFLLPRGSVYGLIRGKDVPALDGVPRIWALLVGIARGGVVSARTREG